MSPRPLDTSLSVWTAYTGALDQMGGPARLRAAVELSESVRELRLAGIRARHPGLNGREVVARWVFEEYGVALPESE